MSDRPVTFRLPAAKIGSDPLPPEPPMSRLLAALSACLFAAAAGAADPPKKLLLVSSPPDAHAPTTHEYTPGLDILAKLLKPVPGVEVTHSRAEGPWKDGPELLDRADGVVVYLTEGAKWLSDDPKRVAAFRRLAARKGAFAVVHWGMGTREAGPIAAFVDLFGGCHGGPDRKHKVVDNVPVAVPDPRHPAASGVKDFTVREEFYYKLKFPTAGRHVPVVRATIDGGPETVCWAWDRPDGGRSFGFSGLHFHENWKREEYRRLVAQGVVWSLGLPVPEGGLSVGLKESDYALPKK